MLANFEPTKPDHVALKEGEAVTVLDSSKRWWHVRTKNGQEGRAPSNYLELEPPLESFPWFHEDVKDRFLAEKRLNM